jgi:peptidoglycan hydrolase-like protein with peptidoglycan-binding domain
MIKSNSFSKASPRFATGIAILAVAVLLAPALVSAEILYRELEVGSRGSDVSSLQTFLATDPGLYPKGLVTGYFGFLTKSAVANFQARNGIAAVGRVGPITLPVINAQMAGGSNVGTDRNAPTISSLAVGTTNSGATLNWKTNEGASAIVYYNTSPLMLTEGSAVNAITVSGFSSLVHTDLRFSHSASLVGLQSNTTYYYVVYVRDGSGNETVTWPAIFRTIL